MKKLISLSCILLIVTVQSSSVFGQRGIKIVKTDKELRTALVIGNSSYKFSRLKNPENDAEDIASTLKKFGFSVTLKTNADQKTMERAIRDFGKKLKKGGVGLFYYAGHGIQLHGHNYILPVDSVVESEGDVKYEAVDAGLVLAKMEDAENDLNIIIFDACRNNPFARSFRSATKGLAKMDAPTGSIIAYSTAPGSVAADGVGRNSPYTKFLLDSLTSSGTSAIERIFKQVRINVMRATDSKQVPWESSSLTGDFYFESNGENKNSQVVSAQHADLFSEGVKLYQAQDYESAYNIWKPLADNGHSEAMFRLADLYEWGNGTDRNIRQAFYYYRKAAISGHGDAQFSYANRLDSGQGTKVYRRKAFFWYNAVMENPHSSRKSKYHSGIMVGVDMNVFGYKLTEREKKLLKILSSSYLNDANQVSEAAFSDY